MVASEWDRKNGQEHRELPTAKGSVQTQSMGYPDVSTCENGMVELHISLDVNFTLKYYK